MGQSTKSIGFTTLPHQIGIWSRDCEPPVIVSNLALCIADVLSDFVDCVYMLLCAFKPFWISLEMLEDAMNRVYCCIHACKTDLCRFSNR